MNGQVDARTDEELVAAVNDGDADAFAALYYSYRDWVVRLAWRFTGHDQDALDVLQETFAYLLGKFPGFSLSARMTTFLYPVVKNTALNLRRKNARYASGGEALSEIPAPPEPDDSRSELSVCLTDLPDPQREVLLMRYVDDLTLSQIATALAIPVGTVKSRIYHALQTLRSDARARRYFEE